MSKLSKKAESLWINTAINLLLKEGRAEEIPKILSNRIKAECQLVLGMKVKEQAGKLKSTVTLVQTKQTKRSINRQIRNMAYNITKQTVKRYEKVLSQIYKDVWLGNKILRFQTNDPRLSYRLREALAAATRLEVEPWNEMDIKIGVDGDIITIERKIEKVDLEFEVLDRVETIEDSVNQFAVVQYMMKNNPQVAIFTNFEGDITVLQNWIDSKDYQIETTNPLTIKKVEASD